MTEKGALAVLNAVRYFRSYLEGSKFKLYREHEPITYILNMAELNGKIARWVGEHPRFDFEVGYRPEAFMKDADAMSRLAIMLPDSHEEANVAKIWEGTEALQRTKMDVVQFLHPWFQKYWNSIMIALNQEAMMAFGEPA